MQKQHNTGPGGGAAPVFDLLAQVVESFPLPVYVKDCSFRYAVVNQRFARDVLQRPPEDILGHTLEEVGPPLSRELLERLAEADRALLADPDGGQWFDLRVPDPDQQPRDVRLIKSACRDADGRVVGVMGILEEFTEERAVEREVVDSIVAEQQRISRVLHNDLSQVITAAAYKIKLIELECGGTAPPEIQARMREALELVNQAAARARAIARELTPVELVEDGLADALDALAAAVAREHSVRCTFRREGVPPVLPKPLANQLYAIALLITRLAVRFLGVTRIEVALDCRGNGIDLAVTFDGRPDADNSSEQQIWERGLALLAFRARLIGGNILYTKNQECANSVSCRTWISSAVNRGPINP